MKHFLLDKNYGAYLSTMGFSVEEVLKKAALPEGLFAQQAPSLTTGEYVRFMQAIDALSPEEQTPIRLAASENIETFSPPIFAAYCSQNGLTCLKRLAQYKPLIGALLYQVEESESAVRVELVSADAELELPEILVGTEFVFMTGLLRKATKAALRPLRATARQTIRNPAYAAFLGTEITTADRNQLVFSKADAQLPFISCNESMWAFFEPELNKRLSMMETDDSYAARVRSALMELLPSGECGIEEVARKLGVQQAFLTAEIAGREHEFSETAEPYAGTAGPVLCGSYGDAGGGYRLSAGVSGYQLILAGIRGVDRKHRQRIPEKQIKVPARSNVDLAGVVFYPL